MNMAPPNEDSSVVAQGESLTQGDIDSGIDEVTRLREELAAKRRAREDGYQQRALAMRKQELDEEKERLLAELAAEDAQAEREAGQSPDVKTAKQLMLEQAAELEAANKAAQDQADAAQAEADPFGAAQAKDVPPPAPTETKTTAKTTAKTTPSGDAAPTGEGK